MATHRPWRVGPPSLLGLTLALLLPLRATASLDPARLVSTVRSGPLEMRVALEDSSYLPGQYTSVLVCVTNAGRVILPFVPCPAPYGDAHMTVRLWKVSPDGAWFPLRMNVQCNLRGISSYMVPPISPLEPSGSTCYTWNLEGLFGADIIPAQFRRDLHEALLSDPAVSLFGSRLEIARYAVQVSGVVPREQNHWPEPVQLRSDTLFFDVSRSIGPREDSLLVHYAHDVDSSLALPRPTMIGVAARWLPRFSNSPLVRNLFIDTGPQSSSFPPTRLFSWVDPYGMRLTSRAMLLDLLLRQASPDSKPDPERLSSYARGDLARRVIQDWRALPWRRSVRDSVYAERRRWLIDGKPPYGTFREDMERSREELEP